jgi:cytochrome c oxidase assembly factor CtaG
MLIGTSVTGPFFMVKVAVPLNVVELLLVMGLPMSLKFDIVWV